MQERTFNEEIHKLAQEIAELVVRKQKDYGTKNILNSPFGAEHGIVVREYDKLSRLANLIGNDKEPNNESIEDTWLDVAGYALVALMVRKGLFTLPLEDK